MLQTFKKTRSILEILEELAPKSLVEPVELI